MVYSNRNRWYNNFDGEKIASKYKVWMAAYFGKFYYDSVRWTYGDDLPISDIIMICGSIVQDVMLMVSVDR